MSKVLEVVTNTFSKFVEILETMDKITLIENLLSKSPQMSSIISALSVSPVHFVGLAVSVYLSSMFFKKHLKGARAKDVREIIEELIEYCREQPNYKDYVPCKYLNDLEKLSKLSVNQLEEILKFVTSLRDQLIFWLGGTPALMELECLLPSYIIRDDVYIDKIVQKVVEGIKNSHDAVVFIITGHRGCGKSVAVRLAIDELIKRKVVNKAIYIKNINREVLENLAKILGVEASKTIIVYDPGWDEAALMSEKINEEITPEILYKLTASSYIPPGLDKNRDKSIYINDLLPSENKPIHIHVRLLKQFKAIVIVLPLEAMELEIPINAPNNVDLRVLSIGYSRPLLEPEVCPCRNISSTAKCEEFIVTLEDVFEFYMKYLENVLKDRIAEDNRLRKVLQETLQELLRYGGIGALGLLGLRAYYLSKRIKNELPRLSSATISLKILSYIELDIINFIRDELLWNKVLNRRCDHAMALGLIHYSLKYFRDVPEDIVFKAITEVFSKTYRHASPQEFTLKWLYIFDVIASQTLPYYDDVFRSLTKPYVITKEHEVLKCRYLSTLLDKMEEIIKDGSRTFESCVCEGLYHIIKDYLDVISGMPKELPVNLDSIVKLFILLEGFDSNEKLAKEVLLNTVHLNLEVIYPGTYRELKSCEYFRSIDKEICKEMGSIQLHLASILHFIKLRDVYKVLLGLATEILDEQRSPLLRERVTNPALLVSLIYAVLNPNVINILPDETRRELFEKYIDVLKRLLPHKETMKSITYRFPGWIIYYFPGLADALHNILRHFRSEALLYRNITDMVETYLKITNLAIAWDKIEHIVPIIDKCYVGKETDSYAEMNLDPLLGKVMEPVFNALMKGIEELEKKYLRKYRFLRELQCPDYLGNIPYTKYIDYFHRFMCALYLKEQLHAISTSIDGNNFMRLMCQECYGPNFMRYVLEKFVNLAINNEADEQRRMKILAMSIPLKLFIAYWEKRSIKEEIEQNKQVLNNYLGELSELILWWTSELQEKSPEFDAKNEIKWIAELILQKERKSNENRK